MGDASRASRPGGDARQAPPEGRGEPEILRDPQELGSVLDEFCLKTLPWYRMNQHEIQEHRQPRQSYEVMLSGGLRSVVDKKTNRHVPKAEDRVMVDGTDVCVPALWLGKECIAYSRAGCSRRWELPSSWKAIGKADVFAIGIEGNRFLEQKPVQGGSINIGLQPGAAVLLTPA